eukprot:jgi/Botrbrau1/21638/Bobra.43_1s0040.1
MARIVLWISLAAAAQTFQGVTAELIRTRISVGSTICDNEQPDRSCCIFEEDDGYNTLAVGSETIMTVEAPRGTTLKLANGQPGDAPIYPAFTRTAYYNGSRLAKPAFLVNYTFPPNLAGLYFRPKAKDLNSTARILLYVTPTDATAANPGCYQLITVTVGPPRDEGTVSTMSMPASNEVCVTVEPYEQCGGINNCPLCPLRSGAGSNYVCRFPLLPRYHACNGTWPNTCCSEGYICKASPGTATGYDFKCYDA